MMAGIFLSFLISMILIFYKKYRPSFFFIFLSLVLIVVMFKVHVTDKLNLNF